MSQEDNQGKGKIPEGHIAQRSKAKDLNQEIGISNPRGKCCNRLSQVLNNNHCCRAVVKIQESYRKSQLDRGNIFHLPIVNNNLSSKEQGVDICLDTHILQGMLNN
jgi:bacterioferritin-associated ferredoxin